MPLTLTIAGVDRTGHLAVNSLSFGIDLSNRSRAEFDLYEVDGAYLVAGSDGSLIVGSDGAYLASGFRPEVGQAIEVSNGGASPVFAGTIEGFEEERLTPGHRALVYHVTCLDNNAIADNRLVYKAYETPGQVAGDIVRDIVTTFLAGEGVTTTYVQDGPEVERAVFNYLSAADALNELAEVTGFLWWIDASKNLHFCAPGTNVAPWGLTDDSGNFRDLRVTSTAKDYRNRQWVRAGHDLTDERTETFVGDGERKTFTLAFPAGTEPTVTVDGTAKTVGIKGVETGLDYYWNKESNELSQDDGASALTSANTLSVTYRGLFPIILSAQDDDQIASMATASGGTGIVENIVNEPTIDQLSMATAKGNGLLRRFGRIPRIVTYETDDDGIEPGQVQPINVAAHALSDGWLVEEVRARDVDGKFLRYEVRALDGEQLGGWIDFFKGLAKTGQTFAVRENEVVTYLRRLKETVTVTDTLSVTSAAPVSMCGEAMCGFSEVA